MSNTALSADVSEGERRRPLLARIASILECPIEDLASAISTSQLAEIAELLRLWNKVAEPTTRRAVVEHLRRAVGEF